MTSMSFKLELEIWPRVTGQRIPCFDRFPLTITGMSNIKDVRYRTRLHVAVSLLAGRGMAVILRDSTVVRMGPRAIPVFMLTMRKSIHGCSFLYGYDTPLDGPSVTGAPQL